MTPYEGNTLGTLFRDARICRMISQKELAGMAGISITNLNRIERNRYYPTVKTMEKIAEALNLELYIGLRIPKN